MKLSKLYTNKPEIFEPISFNTGLNVVLAEIRLPENQKKDTHSLGKSTLGRVIDFCLLAKKDSGFFLFKHIDIFEDFVFFLEIELVNGEFLTIRRSVKEATKISFKKHSEQKQDFNNLNDEDWDHLNIPFEKSKKLLDGLLNLMALKPWSYRKGLGYLLRSQYDYADVYQLRKFSGKHVDWKPYLAHVLGLNTGIVKKHYEKELEEENKKKEISIIKRELGDADQDISKVEGILLLKKSTVEKQQQLLDSFDFRSQDKQKTKKLVEDIDLQIASLNSERYALNLNRQKILTSLKEEQILFSPEKAQQLFDEAGIFFEGQIKKDYEQLVEFNRAITSERRIYLIEEKNEIEARLKDINGQLNKLGKERSDSLQYLSDSDIFQKYKSVGNELVALKADVISLERQKEFIYKIQELEKQIRTLHDEKEHIRFQIEEDVVNQNSNAHSFFSTLRLFFSAIVEEIIDRKALLSVSVNQYGHLEFEAEILDESGNTTSADDGNTYKKFLCIAFDLAMLRAYINDNFPKFVFHDGVLESLDDRKKTKLFDVIREYETIGIQHIITLIDSDLPPQTYSYGQPLFDDSEVILRLHDEGAAGRLFKMPSW